MFNFFQKIPERIRDIKKVKWQKWKWLATIQGRQSFSTNLK